MAVVLRFAYLTMAPCPENNLEKQGEGAKGNKRP
jgi:hypothetical protein